MRLERGMQMEAGSTRVRGLSAFQNLARDIDDAKHPRVEELIGDKSFREVLQGDCKV